MGFNHTVYGACNAADGSEFTITSMTIKTSGTDGFIGGIVPLNTVLEPKNFNLVWGKNLIPSDPAPYIECDTTSAGEQVATVYLTGDDEQSCGATATVTVKDDHWDIYASNGVSSTIPQVGTTVEGTLFWEDAGSVEGQEFYYCTYVVSSTISGSFEEKQVGGLIPLDPSLSTTNSTATTSKHTASIDIDTKYVNISYAYEYSTGTTKTIKYSAPAVAGFVYKVMNVQRYITVDLDVNCYTTSTKYGGILPNLVYDANDSNWNDCSYTENIEEDSPDLHVGYYVFRKTSTHIASSCGTCTAYDFTSYLANSQ